MLLSEKAHRDLVMKFFHLIVSHLFLIFPVNSYVYDVLMTFPPSLFSDCQRLHPFVWCAWWRGWQVPLWARLSKVSAPHIQTTFKELSNHCLINVFKIPISIKEGYKQCVLEDKPTLWLTFCCGLSSITPFVSLGTQKEEQWGILWACLQFVDTEKKREQQQRSQQIEAGEKN